MQFSMRILVGCWLILFSQVFAQDTPPPPEAAQDTASEAASFPLDFTGAERSIQNVPFSLTTFTLSPYSKLRRGRFFAVRCRVVNEQKETDTVTVVTNIVGQPGEQYARSVTLEAGRFKNVDIHLPLPDDYLATSVEVSCTLWMKRNGREVLIDRDGEAIEQRLRLPVDTEATCVTATLLNPAPREFFDWEWPKESSYATYDWLVASRVGAGHFRTTLDLEAYPLPNEMIDWDGIDNLVIADERIFSNYASVQVLKSWLLAGGRVWVMLDHVDPKHIRPLLLSGQYVNQIDSTEITEATLDSTMAFNAEYRNTKFSSENGVKLVKVEQSGGEVSHTVNGWPAAIWMPIGEGELLLTTLGPTAWMQRTKDNSGKPELLRSDFELMAWAGPMGDRFHQSRVRLLSRSPGLQYPVALIGFQVLGREIVAVCLLVFCIVLGGVGYWLYRLGRLEWMGWVAPALSLLAGCGLALGSGLLRKDVPDGWHRIQVINTDGKDRAFLFEQSAMYRQQPSVFPLKINSDAVIDPEIGVGTRDFRATQYSFDEKVVTSEGWPTGIWRMESQSGFTQRIDAATGTWSEKGLIVRLPEQLLKLESLLISQPRAPKSQLQPMGDEGWLISEASTLPPTEFAASSGLVDDRFFRRAEVLTESFSPAGGEARPKSLQIMGWGNIAAAGFQWDEDGSDNVGTGDALWRLPLISLPPSLNTQIQIPPALIRWDVVDSGVGISGAFMRSTGEWNGPFTNAMTTALKPEIPEEVFPLQCQKVRLATRVRAAGRDVIFSARTKTGKKELGKFFSPQQVIRLDIEDAELLQALNDRSLDLIIEVSGLSEKDDKKSGFVQAVPWQIEYLWMTVDGIANYEEKK
jgi:hypothetical protein